MSLLDCILRNDQNTGRKVCDILNAFGVDCYGHSTFLGRGAFKEVHRTNIPGVVLFLTNKKKQFDEEVFILELLNEYGFPAMKYYSIENIDGVVIALGEMLKPHEDHWSQARTQAICDQVEGWLLAIINEGIYIGDLQFMLDDDDQPVFIDPLHIRDMVLGLYGDGSYLSAMCKDNRSRLSVFAVKDD